jgi:hypothetical protein
LEPSNNQPLFCLVLQACGIWPGSTTMMILRRSAHAAKTTTLRTCGSQKMQQLRWQTTGSEGKDRDLDMKVPAYYIWGAGTDVGKTLISCGICNAAAHRNVRLQIPPANRKSHFSCGAFDCTATKSIAWMVAPRFKTVSFGVLSFCTLIYSLTTWISLNLCACFPFIWVQKDTGGDVFYFKPVQTGFPQDSDADQVFTKLSNM